MSYSSEVLADSPVSYWRLSDVSGPTAVDQLGVNNGTYTGCTFGVTGLVSGDADTAVTLDGIDDNVLCKSGRILSGLTNWTVEAWVLTGTSQAAIYCERAASGNDILKVQTELAGGKLQLTYRDDAGTLDQLSSATQITDVAAHHVVVTKSGTTIELYVDGVDDGGGTLTAGNTFTDASALSGIGADLGASAQFLAGTLDEVAVYSTALSAARVAAHFNWMSSMPPEQTAIWPYNRQGPF